MNSTVDPKIWNKLRKVLDELIEQKRTGKVVIATEEVISEIYLLTGRLLYVVDKIHRVRRWERAVKKHCSPWQFPEVWTEEQPWEYGLLAQGISKKQINLKQVKAAIEQVTQECFLELMYYQSVKFLWNNQEMNKSPLSYCLSLSASEIHPILSNVEDILIHGQNSGLTVIKPSLAPLVNGKSDGVNLPFNPEYLTGDLTIWDLANKLGKSIVEIDRILVPLVEKGIVQLKTVPDLPSKFTTGPRPKSTPEPVKTPVTQTNQYLGTVACIDDSPVVTHNLQKILNAAGYKSLAIPEPMAGFAELIEHKPDLILLDLNLPNANGYSVCKFLRETPVFGKTPIIILTSQDTVIDRTRAKLVGANDFIAKPPEPEQLLQMLAKYIDNKQGTAATTSPSLRWQPGT